MPISVVVNTRNAELFLEEVLASLEGFDEILVCDMESTDRTLEISRQFGCRIVNFPAEAGNIVEVAREFAIHQAANEWVLVVDADEVVTMELREALCNLAQNDDCDGYMIHRKNKFLGEFERSFNKDHQLRFIRKSKTHWPAVIHSKPQVDGRIGSVNADGAMLIHLQDRSIRKFVETYNLYTDHEIQKRSNKRYGSGALLFRPLFAAFRYYFLQGGWRNGKRGPLHAGVIAMYELVMVMKILERHLK